ncbi:Homocysteine S-methyltransferase [Paraphaeosphaeria sporulosa]|uniref:Homocysteine S-methyltransferase n=1 Tax=Paraphaeosphaeria sporulosa TaxID=1460663 RepID=A0A177CYW6_9PLEO|nr:Homocysteine S-methyltransferase [Paraphaeosphaeria sporulosa]OAG12703.1 Homocysteine S-methyltransferase [Paraphaeosphaeria sporulosa]
MAPTTSKDVVILDGGMSRELIRLQAPFRQPEWSALALLEAPHFVRQAHADFAAAGAHVLTTNSYALVPFHIGLERFQARGEELAALAGRLARETADSVAGKSVRVAGSLPPIFGSYEPDLYDPALVQERLAVLVRGLAPYVDVWLGETLSLVAEAEAVRVATRESGKPVWIAFTLDDGGVDAESAPARLRSGESVNEAAQWAVKAGVEALLFNCSQPEYMDAAIKDARQIFEQEATVSGARAPLIGVYANAFEPKAGDEAANEAISDTRAELTPELYLEFAQRWVESGATIVGGCCGIGCDHIRKVAGQNLISV